MRLISFTTSNWNSEAQFLDRLFGDFGIKEWMINSSLHFGECEKVIACGTWSDPKPLEGQVTVINAGIVSPLPYCTLFWHYADAAWRAGLSHLLNRRMDWEMIVALDTDCLVGSVDFDALLREFWERPELILSPDWFGSIGGPFIALKHEAALRLVYSNPVPCLILERTVETIPEHRCIEHRWAQLFKGAWWNPWPDIPSMRMDYPGKPASETDFSAAMNWPFVRQPAPNFVGPYRRKHQPKPFVQRPKEAHSLVESVGP